MTSASLLTPRQAADKIGISYPALKHWILAGRIRTVKTPADTTASPSTPWTNSCPPPPPIRLRPHQWPQPAAWIHR